MINFHSLSQTFTVLVSSTSSVLWAGNTSKISKPARSIQVVKNTNECPKHNEGVRLFKQLGGHQCGLQSRASLFFFFGAIAVENHLAGFSDFLIDRIASGRLIWLKLSNAGTTEPFTQQQNGSPVLPLVNMQLWHDRPRILM